MKKPFLIAPVLLLTLVCSSQPYNPANVDKKAVALYNQAIERASAGNLALAAGLLLQAIEWDKKYVEAYLSLGGVYGQMKNYSNSVDYYEKAFAIDPDFTLEFKLPYSINLAGAGQFSKALDAITELLTKKPPKNQTSLKAAEYRKRCFEFAVDYASKHSSDAYVFAPKNVGSGVNTAESEYWPSLTIDGKELVFTRRLNNYNEDFFSSIQMDTGWDKAQSLKGNINTRDNEGAQSISQDGQVIVFAANNRRDGWGNFDIYVTYLTPQGWGDAINVGNKINSDQWDSQPSLSPDKRDLYFASRRPGGLGGSDIYVSRLLPNGRWGEPENMGPGINTSGDEQCPFIHADNQTLYFTSNYWPGYGDDDLFYTRKGPNESWSKPLNLGYPINTIHKEGTLFISSNGTTAYYASDRGDSKGGLDIYSFDLREDIRPYKTLWVKGQVFDQKTKQGLPSAVELIDLKTKQTLSRVQTDEQGTYLITLPVGKDYAFNVNRQGYLFYSDNFLLTEKSPDSVYKKDIPLQPIEINASVVLKNIFFPTKEFVLNPESQVELDKVVQLLTDNPTVKIQITGHTDNIGKPADNLVLSNNRAKAVVNYLKEKGIAVNRLSFKGFGETKPMAPNTSDDGRSKNRRTEMVVISK
jgi:outer membrane protein OmpA-like peptidoglycan-associated protein/tetratricopeptide (TPR) repeat protein